MRHAACLRSVCKTLRAGLVVSICLCASLEARAGDLLPDGPKPPPTYRDNAKAKLSTGLIYMGIAPIHLIEDPLQGTIDGPPLIGSIGGIGQGLMCGSVMALSGAVNVLTFWVPAWWIDARRYYPSCILSIDQGEISPLLRPVSGP